jgi:hypothetical protein
MSQLAYKFPTSALLRPAFRPEGPSALRPSCLSAPVVLVPPEDRAKPINLHRYQPLTSDLEFRLPSSVCESANTLSTDHTSAQIKFIKFITLVCQNFCSLKGRAAFAECRLDVLIVIRSSLIKKSSRKIQGSGAFLSK